MSDNLKRLDVTYRLTPWSLPVHNDFVAGRYGALLENPAAAENYRLEYVKKEKEFDEAYEHQRKMLREASVKLGDKPQELPDLEKIDWDPRKRFAVREAPKEVKPKEEPKVPQTGLAIPKESKKVEKKVK